MIEAVRNKVLELLENENSGHGMEHIDRVVRLTKEFSLHEGANSDIATLIALLHDVDDYKLFGMESAKNLSNANRILDECNILLDIKKQVIDELSCIGYSKSLKGIRPSTLEGMIVSDADMCDGIGATGILRSYQYNIKHGNLFFDREWFPDLNMDYQQYTNKKTGTVVNHMFEKLLKLKDLMLTESGRKEAQERHNLMLTFLYQFFKEENALDWIKYLDDYVK